MHVILGDGAGFHHRQSEEGLPLNVKIITLPAYSPELNPVEKLWDIVKDGICNRDWTDLDELEEEIIKRIKPSWEDAKRVTRLIGNGYLHSELNAILKIELRQHNWLNCMTAHLVSSDYASRLHNGNGKVPAAIPQISGVIF